MLPLVLIGTCQIISKFFVKLFGCNLFVSDNSDIRRHLDCI